MRMEWLAPLRWALDFFWRIFDVVSGRRREFIRDRISPIERLTNLLARRLDEVDYRVHEDYLVGQPRPFRELAESIRAELTNARSEGLWTEVANALDAIDDKELRDALYSISNGIQDVERDLSSKASSPNLHEDLGGAIRRTRCEILRTRKRIRRLIG